MDSILWPGQGWTEPERMRTGSNSVSAWRREANLSNSGPVTVKVLFDIWSKGRTCSSVRRGGQRGLLSGAHFNIINSVQSDFFFNLIQALHRPHVACCLQWRGGRGAHISCAGKCTSCMPPVYHASVYTSCTCKVKCPPCLLQDRRRQGRLDDEICALETFFGG